MIRSFVATACAVLAFALACGTAAEAKSKKQYLGLVYTRYQGLTSVPGSHEVRFGAREVSQLDELERACRTDLKRRQVREYDDAYLRCVSKQAEWAYTFDNALQGVAPVAVPYGKRGTQVPTVEVGRRYVKKK